MPQRVLQLTLLAGYAVLVVLGWGSDGIPGVPELHPRMYTHATPLLFWVVWFMGLVLLAPAAGRAWCGVCPLGWLSDFLGRRGLGLVWPAWVKRGMVIPVVFLGGMAAVLWGEAHRSPHRTAVLVAAVAVAAVASGLLWRRSAFCRGLCPVGAALHLYSRHGPVAVRPVSATVCRGCADRSCTDRKSGWYRWRLGNLTVQRRISLSGCPVALDPATMDPGACLLCLRCIRQCSMQNLGIFWGEKPKSRGIDGARLALLVFLCGLLCVALLRTWPAAKEFLTPGAVPTFWFSLLWLGLAVPVLLLLGPAALSAAVEGLRGEPVLSLDAVKPARARSVGSKDQGFWLTASRFATAFVGPVLGAHGALALVKLNAKAGYVPYLAYDPWGASTYAAIHVSRTLPLPDLLVSLSWLRWLALGILFLGVAAGVREATRQWSRQAPPVAGYSISFVFLAGLFGAALVHWLFPWGR